MSSVDVSPGKKVKLEVYSGDADELRQKGQAFFQALQGKTIQADDRVLFGDSMISVKDTKPKGPVQIGKYTAIKMSVSKKPVSLDCPSCGKSHSEPQETCEQCGTSLGLVSI